MSRNTSVPGLAPKPDYCLNNCPRGRYGGVGFVPDWYGKNPKLSLVLVKPTKEETLERNPFSSGYSRFFFATVGKQLGLRRDDLVVSYVLRCSGSYPIGKTRKLAEQTCRAWDCKSADTRGLPGIPGGLVRFDPNLFIVTFGLDDALEVDAFQSCMVNDIEKALRFAGSGFRPCVLMGKEAMELMPCMSGQTGGVKKWRGHHWEGSWPWKDNQLVAPLRYDKKVTEYVQIEAAPNQPPSEQKTFDFGA